MAGENVQIEGLSQADRRAEILRARTVARENPVGTIIMGGWGTAPRGYLLLDGSLITNGATFYRDLATVYPSWVSGANLQLPDMTGAVPLGGSPTGVVAGSMSVMLTAANLADHTHGIDHQHTMAHDHSIDPPNTSTTSDSHSHTYWSPGANKFVGNAIQTDAAAVRFSANTSSDSHSHTVNIAAFTSGGSSAANTGGATPPTSGGTGTPTAVDITPKHMTVMFAVKH